MKYLHLFSRDENCKFSTSYYYFIKNNFCLFDHNFVVINKNESIGSEKNIQVLSLKFHSIFRLIKKMYMAKRIYLHGLDFYMILLLLFQPWFLKKTNWIIWGGDLYFHILKKRSIRNTIYDFTRKLIIKNVGGMITQVKGDYELAREWYQAKGKYYYCFLYPSNLYKDIDLSKITKEKDKLYIQVGNSACTTNEHIEVFEKLAKFKNSNIIIICPLSYSGEKDYIDKVILKGLDIFGKERFFPIVNFIPFQDYVNLLGKIDVAIFNHRRQRALGNITTLLGLGKKVYIRTDITTWDFCENHGLVVYSANKEFNDIFDPISIKDKESNKRIMKEAFSMDKLASDWGKIFSA
ncbi:TDP-N-acetylfucosamine:lipid II N-acetylfucosaminyltransferase [Mesobacillus subterraneus]|uniref:TDP-N-acetylfucosamine:lipid II N-acetylfucosaminyltransferase n=1 Tax=Mesobacillus subterraneus TaxID=285983 RepID=UPI0014760EB7|nr:TDP-N-acetylfucosamine:lipid II N-acetylfucosaminyltransferase [Mesobacillus subterraneus]